MTKYAADTKVSSEKSRMEIERTLKRYGADQFLYGLDTAGVVIGFRMHARHVKFTIKMPDPASEEFTHYRRGHSTYERTADAAATRHEQACRQRWRALALVIKAKLEAVESGITEFQDEFLAHIMLPNGDTFGRWAKPEIEKAYLSGDMPALLPGPGD